LGTGRPITWQGWVLTVVFGAAAALCGYVFQDRPAALIAAMVPLVFGFLVIAARKTKGGWRWRWGSED